MKLSTITISISLLNAFAAASLSDNRGSSNDGAVTESSASSKLRRAAEALDDLLDNHEDVLATMAHDPACYDEDGDCTLARREAVELAAAVAEARAAANPAAVAAAQENTPEGWCDAPGGFCDRTKRSIEARKRMQKRSGGGGAQEGEHEEYMRVNCHRPGNECHEMRRRAEWGARGKSIKDFINKMVGTVYSNTKNPTNMDVHSGWVDVPSSCAGVGQACIKLKRAQDLIMDLAASEPGFDNDAGTDDGTDDVHARAEITDEEAGSNALVQLGKLVARRRAVRDQAEAEAEIGEPGEYKPVFDAGETRD